MIKHIVMWTLKDEAAGADRAANARKMKEMLEALRGVVPSLAALEVGVEVFAASPACDVILYSEFASRADLDAYQVHPEHQKVVAFVKQVAASRSVVDYEA
ncbi:Stress responsive A/B Barrel Domain [Humidesulfovibrio mexicanus]|uniref:Stress responsive A/B Barrel Domain n=1 Tax=Humidesulfovibrio mexicanus TaxID=147047 RepID=A0A238Z4H8_9BACT|nr:Dabb family protein [Humidesulfovibrio mexicanus]SNR77879.1 Stress responsive A/B Barrel Domain [Humidesulfovibrio mexicanus]